MLPGISARAALLLPLRHYGAGIGAAACATNGSQRKTKCAAIQDVAVAAGIQKGGSGRGTANHRSRGAKSRYFVDYSLNEYVVAHDAAVRNSRRSPVCYLIPQTDDAVHSLFELVDQE